MLMSGKWFDRITIGVIIWVIQSAHQHAVQGVENTPFGMLLYHGFASLADFAIIVVVANCLKGKLSFHLQCLNLCAMVANAIGWFAYLAYLPPDLYNTTIAGLGYVQFLRIIWISRDDPDYPWTRVVRDNYPGRHQLYTSTTNP
jgi:hypothetical protein